MSVDLYGGGGDGSAQVFGKWGTYATYLRPQWPGKFSDENASMGRFNALDPSGSYVLEGTTMFEFKLIPNYPLPENAQIWITASYNMTGPMDDSCNVFTLTGPLSYGAELLCEGAIHNRVKIH